MKTSAARALRLGLTIAVASVYALPIGSAKAGGSLPMPELMGPTPLSCGAWLSAADAAKGAYPNPMAKAEYEAWALGFLSGLVLSTHMATQLGFTDTRGNTPVDVSDAWSTTDAASIEYAINKKCRENPLDGLGPVVAQIFNDLARRSVGSR